MEAKIRVEKHLNVKIKRGTNKNKSLVIHTTMKRLKEKEKRGVRGKEM